MRRCRGSRRPTCTRRSSGSGCRCARGRQAARARRRPPASTRRAAGRCRRSSSACRGGAQAHRRLDLRACRRPGSKADCRRGPAATTRSAASSMPWRWRRTWSSAIRRRSPLGESKPELGDDGMLARALQERARAVASAGRSPTCTTASRRRRYGPTNDEAVLDTIWRIVADARGDLARGAAPLGAMRVQSVEMHDQRHRQRDRAAGSLSPSRLHVQETRLADVTGGSSLFDHPLFVETDEACCRAGSRCPALARILILLTRPTRAGASTPSGATQPTLLRHSAASRRCRRRSKTRAPAASPTTIWPPRRNERGTFTVRVRVAHRLSRRGDHLPCLGAAAVQGLARQHEAAVGSPLKPVHMVGDYGRPALPRASAPGRCTRRAACRWRSSASRHSAFRRRPAFRILRIVVYGI